MDRPEGPQESRCPRCDGDAPAEASTCPFCRYEFLDGYARRPRDQADSDVPRTGGATATAETRLDHATEEAGAVKNGQRTPRKSLTRRQRWGCASLLAIGIVLLVGLANEPRAQPYSGIDSDKYTTLTCGEWLAAPPAQQVGWADLDKAVSLLRAATDAAKANIEASSVQEWVGLIKDACQSEPASTLAFPPT